MQTPADDYYTQYLRMTDDEKLIYNYLCDNEGIVSATEYLDYIKPVVNERTGKAHAEGLKELPKWLKPLGYGAYGVVKGIDDFASGVQQNFSKEPLTPSSLQYGSDELQDDLDGLNRTIYDALVEAGKFVPRWFLNGIPGFGNFTQALSSVGNKYGDALRDGKGELEARLYGLTGVTPERIAEKAEELQRAYERFTNGGLPSVDLSAYPELQKLSKLILNEDFNAKLNDMLRNGTGEALKALSPSGVGYTADQLVKKFGDLYGAWQDKRIDDFIDRVWNGVTGKADGTGEELVKGDSISKMFDAIDNEPGMSIDVGRVDFRDTKSVENVLLNAKKKLENLDHEVNCTVTRDGKIWCTAGDPETARIDLSKIGSDLRGSHSYHNHTQKDTHYSFSEYDAAFFIESGADVSEASDYLFEYSMRRTPETIEKSYEEVYYRFREIVKTDVMRMKYYEEIDPDLDEYHEAMKILSKELHFYYERKKKGE